MSNTDPRISREEFKVLLKQGGLPVEGGDPEQLYEGFLKLRAMVSSLDRPSDLDTGLATEFRPRSLA